MVDKEKRDEGNGIGPISRQGDADEVTRYRQILAREPSSLVFASLAEAYRKRNLLKEAVHTCKKGLRIHPNFVSGRVALARTYAEQGKSDLAQKELERVVLSAPDNLVAQRLLVDVYRETRDLERLEKTLHRILALDTKDEMAREGLRWINEQRGCPPTTVDPDGSNREILTKTLAEIYAGQGHYEKAFGIYQKLSLLNQDNPFFHERLADLKEKLVSRSPRTRTQEEAKELPQE